MRLSFLFPLMLVLASCGGSDSNESSGNQLVPGIQVNSNLSAIPSVNN